MWGIVGKGGSKITVNTNLAGSVLLPAFHTIGIKEKKPIEIAML